MAVASLVAKVEAQVASFQKQFSEATRTAQKFEKDFADTASSVTAQQRRITQAFETFSGDRLAREASAVATAVGQIGGAAKLTAGEQARVNSVMADAILKYQALGQQAPKAITDLEAATRKLVTTTEAVKTPTGIFANSLRDLEERGTGSSRVMGLLSSTFGQFTAAGVAVGILNRVVGALSEMVSTGVKLAPVEAAFDRLAEGVGENSQQMLGSLQTATRGLVSNYDLMLASNKAVLLGLPVTRDSMTELARTASILGKAMGQDATKSFDDLITALGRSSPLILDNLGLTVKVEEANQKYAESLGKTADQLTDNEKKLAFYTETLRKARERTAQIGEQTLTLGEVASTVWTSVGNVVSRAVSAINVAGGAIVSETATGVSKVSTFLSNLSQNGIKGALAMGFVNEQMAKVVQSSNAGTFTKPAASAEDFATKAARLTKELGQLTAQQKANIDAGRLLGKSNKDIAESQTGMAGAIKVTEDHLSLMEKLQRAQDESQRQAAASAREHARDTKEQAKALKDMIDPLVTITKGLGDLQHVLPGIVDVDTLSGWSRLEEQMGRVSDRIREMASHPLTSLPGTAVQLPQVKLPQTFWQKVFVPSEIGSAIGNAISGAIQGGGNVFAAAAGALGQGMMSKLSGFLTTAKDKGGFGLSGLLGNMVSSVLPGVGALLGPLVGKLTDTLRTAFGGPSQDELAGRQVVAQFEASLLSTLTAAEKLAAGNESWKITTIAVRDAYIAAGKSAAEAEAAVKKLWDSSRSGADVSRIAVLEIQAVMDVAAAKQRDLADQQGDSLDGLGAKAEDAARDIEDAMSRIRIEPIRVPVEVDGPGGFDVPALATGGIVRKPTLALIGEAGPEAVVPLSGNQQFRPAETPVVVNNYIDGRPVAEAIVPHIPHVVRRMG